MSGAKSASLEENVCKGAAAGCVRFRYNDVLYPRYTGPDDRDQRWHAKKTVIPMLFQWLQRSYSSPGTPKSHCHQNIGFRLKFGRFIMKFAEIWVQKQILVVPRGPLPARDGNRDIPIGILRFLSLPGPLRSFQSKGNQKISVEIALFQSKTGFSAPGVQKWFQNVTFIKGFWQGPPMLVFGPPGAFLVARIIKGCIFRDSIGSYRIP